MQNLRDILSVLADGHFHSGAALATRLGLSRTAIWKQIRRLSQQYNIPVQAVQGRGYRLDAPLELLDAGKVVADLSPSARSLLGELQVEWSLDSTNQTLLKSPEAACGTVLVAEHQRQGRGRRGRNWVSPFAANLTFSLLWCFQAPPANLSSLSLAMGVGIVRALSAQGITELGLKWPNDILLRGKKLCGVLLELQGEAGGPCRLVCGVGLNVLMPESAAVAIDQPWTDLQHLRREPFSRHQLLVSLLDSLLPALPRFEQDGLDSFVADWRRWDAVAGQPVQLLLPQQTIQGRAAGIDEQGNLLIDRDGVRETYSSGEISLRTGAQASHAAVN